MDDAYVFTSEIMKACDIRGVVGEELTDRDAYYVGRSFGTVLRRRNKTVCVVGYDGRLTSPQLVAEAVRGLSACGIQVVRVGLVPTPVVYFAVPALHADAGLIVTASHNPAEYNGFKFVLSDELFHGDRIREIALLSDRADFVDGEGEVRDEDIIPEYIQYIHSVLDLPFDRDLSVVWDPGNGASAAILGPFLEGLPGNHTVICGDVDGRFPNHHPDPNLKKHMEMLQQAVIENAADLGIAFDGDGDRLGVVDGEGYVLLGDQLLTLFAREFLREHPGETVMSEVKASKFFYDDVASHGGNALMWKVGHTNQKEKMLQEGIQLAGETSGHIFFAENRGYDDGLFAAVKLLNLLGHSRKSLVDIRKEFPVYHDSGEIRLALDAEMRTKVISEISKRLRADGRPIVDIDGIRVSCDDGFWLMRGSNTQPHITIRCESSSAEGLENCLQDLRHQLALSGIDLDREAVFL